MTQSQSSCQLWALLRNQELPDPQGLSKSRRRLKKFSATETTAAVPTDKARPTQNAPATKQTTPRVKATAADKK
jgi:hypothetical protein